MKIITIVLLTLLNTVLILQIYHERNINEEKRIEEAWQKKEIASSLCKKYIYENNKIQINKLESNRIINIIDTSYKLFFKIPITYCDACINPMLKDLHTLTKEIDHEKIILITSFPTKQEIDDFRKKMNIINIKIINIPDNNFTLDSKEIIGAYLFLLNKEMVARYIFFCSKYNSFCNSSYLEVIKKHLIT